MDDNTISRSSGAKVGILRVLAGLLSAGVLVVSVASATVLHFADRLSGNIATVEISNGPEPPSPPAEAPIFGTDKPISPSTEMPPVEDNSLNILLMGSDSRDGENAQYGDPSVHSSSRSDVTILLNISGDRKSATAVSFPRDLWTTLPECQTAWGQTAGGYEGKFNAAYQYGGPACTVSLVQNITGLEIDHFAVIDFTGFKNTIDALGGVEICLPNAVSDQSSGLSLPAGVSILDGEQALAYVRARKQLSDGSDISRIGRQQQFLSALLDQVARERLVLNPIRLYQVLDVATQSLTTDTNLGSVESLATLAAEMSQLTASKVDFKTVPWFARGDGENVVINEVEAELLWRALNQEQVPERRGGKGNKDTTGNTERGSEDAATENSPCQ